MRSNASSKIYNVYIFLKYGATLGRVGHGLGGVRPNCGYRCITVKGGGGGAWARRSCALQLGGFCLVAAGPPRGPGLVSGCAGRSLTCVGEGGVRGVLAGAVASRVRSWRGWRCPWASPPSLCFLWWRCLLWSLWGIRVALWRPSGLWGDPASRVALWFVTVRSRA